MTFTKEALKPFEPTLQESLKAFELLCVARSLSLKYEEEKEVTSKYVHATSRGHEVIQIAAGMQLSAQDYLSVYYRDDALLLSIGMSGYDLMLQLMAKKDDPFSGGRTYYAHPSLNDPDKPKIPHQSSATGMQAIPAAGMALGLQYKQKMNLLSASQKPIVLCSLGDASITEGEVSEAFHMAALKQLPIVFLVQDNEWDISAHASEIRTGNAYEYAQGFKGLNAVSIDGTNFEESFSVLQKVVHDVRERSMPYLVHATCPLLHHHTSGVRKEWYRDDLKEAEKADPLPKFKAYLKKRGVVQAKIIEIEKQARQLVDNQYKEACKAPNPEPESLTEHFFAPTPVKEEKGERSPEHKEPVVMVDAALFAMRELMEQHPECLLYGQDVGARLGGVFREAATLGKTFGDTRVFNTPIQEAFIIGSTVGMSAVGLKPVVEVQFADYIWPGLNQLFTELSRSYYLSNGKWPVHSVIRVPIGAYGSGGPYHSSSVESVLCNIKGIKVVYPSTGADLKGLLKAAYYDPNPVVVLEHKGLYWSKIDGTEKARTVEPSENYQIPLGLSRLVLSAEEQKIQNAQSAVVITYGRGVYWALQAAEHFKGCIEIIDLRSLVPLDTQAIFSAVKRHGKCMVLTEESVPNSFAQALTGNISSQCFEYLDAPVSLLGSVHTPAIPLNENLEKTLLPSKEKVVCALEELLAY